jgi:hypothetical protein
MDKVLILSQERFEIIPKIDEFENFLYIYFRPRWPGLARTKV